MDEFLRQLLNRLDVVGLENEEVYDSECRERMSSAVMNGFVRGNGAESLADDFGLHCPEANRSVKSALADCIEACNREAAERHLVRFHDRLAEFQNSKVRSEVKGNYFVDFFGHTNPDWFGQVFRGACFSQTCTTTSVGTRPRSRRNYRFGHATNRMLFQSASVESDERAGRDVAFFTTVV